MDGSGFSYIKSIIIKNCSINVNDSDYMYVGAVCGYSTGRIIECANINGSIIVNSGSYNHGYIGGIVGYLSAGGVGPCSNTSNIYVYGSASGYYVGGIAGGKNGTAGVGPAYNGGDVNGGCNAGGILGGSESGKFTIGNSYNYSSNISAKTRYGGIFGYIKNKDTLTITNAYSIDTIPQLGYNYTSAVKTGRVPSEELKGYASILGNTIYTDDTLGINNGYPIFKWQAEHPEAFMNLIEEIYTPEDLTSLKAQVDFGLNYEGTNVTLMNDIDMTGVTWNEGIGSSTAPFNGTINGDGHKISNLTVSNDEVFNYIDKGGGLENVKFDNMVADGLVDDLNNGNLTNVGIKGNMKLVNTATAGKIENCYSTGGKICSTNAGVTIINAYGKNDNDQYVAYSNTTENNVNESTIKGYETRLGADFIYDYANVNNGFPILTMEDENKITCLNKNRAYIKVGATLNVSVQESTDTYTWSSSNASVATVSSSGVVTGVADGETTIYAFNSENDLYAMAIVDVTSTENVANAEIETGNGFTTILKPNGTVWSIGKNDVGQLGNGITNNSNKVVQVIDDNDNNLSNIVKISAGGNDVLALTATGSVYKWGDGTAKASLIENLSNIVDIENGNGVSLALDSDGNVYNIEGEITQINELSHIIDISCGDGFITALDSSGIVWGYGENENGQLGIGCTDDINYFMKSANDVIKIEDYLGNTTITKVDGNILNSGIMTSSTTYMTKPDENYENLDVLKVSRNMGDTHTAIIVENGDVYTKGTNAFGQVGYGNADASYSNYTKMWSDLNLLYKEDSVDLTRNGYQIDSNFLYYGYEEFNVNTDTIKYADSNQEVGELQFTSSDINKVTVDNTGCINLVEKDVQNPFEEYVTITDITNNKHTILNVIVNKNVYYIYNEIDLIEFRNTVNEEGTTYENYIVYLMEDIKLTESWTSIGIAEAKFNGIFNGNYHKISNLDNTLFNYLDSNSTVENLFLDVKIDKHEYRVAGLVLKCDGGYINNVGIYGRITIRYGQRNKNDDGRIGGIVAEGSGIIDRCYNKASITTIDEKSHFDTLNRNLFVGGLVGLGDFIIDSCYNIGQLSFNEIAGEQHIRAGGIIGGSLSKNKIKGCYNSSINNLKHYNRTRNNEYSPCRRNNRRVLQLGPINRMEFQR